jgi:hypothetical protein
MDSLLNVLTSQTQVPERACSCALVDKGTVVATRIYGIVRPSHVIVREFRTCTREPITGMYSLTCTQESCAGA